MNQKTKNNEWKMERKKPCVLVVGPIFPEGGGVGMVDRILLTSSLVEQYEMKYLDTGRTKVGEGKEGKLSWINIYYYLHQLSQLIWILTTKKPDILHQTVTDGIAFWKELSFILIARSFGVKTIAHMHGCTLDTQYQTSTKWKRRLMSTALRIPHVILVLNKYLYNFLSEQNSHDLNLVIIPNSVDLSIAEAMEKIVVRKDKNECLVLFLGWLCQRKGLPDALAAIPLVRERAPETRFIFAGAIEPGLQKEYIQGLCETAKKIGNVTFPGLVTGNEKLTILSEADIFILPSYHENLPVAILEAMAMGLPVITTPIAGVPELIDDGVGGFLTQPGDYVALAESILRLVHDPALRWAMGQVNIAKVRNDYSPRVFTYRIAHLYERLTQPSFTVEGI